MSQKLTFNKLLLIILIPSVLFLSGCGEGSTILDDTDSTPQGIDLVIEGNNKLAFDLYSKLTEKPQENIFFSPYSISYALTMTYEGAGGQTAEEMSQVLHIVENDTVRRSSSAAIYNDINKKNKKYSLSTANALWTHLDYKFSEDYIKTIENYYGGEATNLDFINDSEKSRQTINMWVEDKTNEKIKNIIPQGFLSESTRLVLINAIYFKGVWAKQFKEKHTQDEDFTTTSGEKIKTPMMRLLRGDFKYAETDEIQILEMDYKGEDLSMLIILPRENNLDDIESSLTNEKLKLWESMLSEQYLNIYIPKFKFETSYTISEYLKQMGIKNAFSHSSANFSKIDGTGNLFISDVLHKAFVEVNEEGTEAAAATSVVVNTAESVSPEPKIFRADHPFIFIIQQKNTQNILFLGRVGNPQNN